MKKQTLLLLGVSMMLTLTVKAQVGVNNTSPKATLDITAKTTDGTAPEGFIGPRLTGDQIKAADAQYTAVHTGMMIYATAAVTTASAKTVNMTAPGYYVFDGTVWNKVGTSVQNIYTADGTLTGNRTVSQAANDLAFTNTATTGTSHFTVDGNTLNVDAVNNRVGIGTNVPLVKLDVAGAILSRGGATVDRQGTQIVWNDANLGGAGLGYSGILNHRGIGSGGFVFSGTADNTTFTEYMRILGDGRVGIGTATPTVRLDARGAGTDNAIAVGGTTQSATAAGTGAIRYNTTLGQLEYSNGTTWVALVAGNAPSYIQIKNTVDQTISAAGTKILFQSTITSAGAAITYNTSTGDISLPAGRTYRLDFNPAYVRTNWVRYAFYNNTTNAAISHQAQADIFSDTLAINSNGNLTYFITTPAGSPTSISLRVTALGGSSILGIASANLSSNLSIQSID
ncbi:hypothetical protein [Chryseobacterium sp. KCF3-3]|uniref:hypothetical protein n=1 Tax=Chryseobacterium sp. KCF3-3 TaxID=3231511 RepID=UPI0038B2B7CF